MDIIDRHIIYNIKEVVIRQQPSQKLTTHLLEEIETHYIMVILLYILFYIYTLFPKKWGSDEPHDSV